MLDLFLDNVIFLYSFDIFLFVFILYCSVFLFLFCAGFRTHFFVLFPFFYLLFILFFLMEVRFSLFGLFIAICFLLNNFLNIYFFYFCNRVKSGGNGVVFCLESENIEAAIAKAVSAGAVAEGEVAECEGACGGGRVGKVTDPYGYVWQFCTPAKKVVGDVEA